jgi:hypothetical protein
MFVQGQPAGAISVARKEVEEVTRGRLSNATAPSTILDFRLADSANSQRTPDSPRTTA